MGSSLETAMSQTIRNTPPLFVQVDQPRSSRRRREHPARGWSAAAAPRDQHFPTSADNALAKAGTILGYFGLSGVSAVAMVNGPKAALEAKRQERYISPAESLKRAIARVQFRKPNAWQGMQPRGWLERKPMKAAQAAK
jgi:hypothetical protein